MGEKWTPVIALQEEVTNRCMLQNRKRNCSERYIKRQWKLSGENTRDDRKGTVEEASKSD